MGRPPDWQDSWKGTKEQRQGNRKRESRQAPWRECCHLSGFRSEMLVAHDKSIPKGTHCLPKDSLIHCTHIWRGYLSPIWNSCGRWNENQLLGILSNFSQHKKGHWNGQGCPKLEWIALEDSAIPVTGGIWEEVSWPLTELCRAFKH